MKWATYHSPSIGTPRIGLVRDGMIYGLSSYTTMLELLAEGSLAMGSAMGEAIKQPFEIIPEAEALLLAPVPVPPSIRDFMAFETHTKAWLESRGQPVHPAWYDIPVFYFTNPAAVRGPRDHIEIFPGSSAFDYELEIAVIIGKRGRDISVEHAVDYIAGYTILCDWSARDLQEKEIGVGLGPAKAKDGATTLGPYLVTPDEFIGREHSKGFNLLMTAHINGELYSKGSMADLYWTFPQMISYASRGTDLVPGDIIGSGTVGTGCIMELSTVHGREKYPWLRHGDKVRLEIESVGVLTMSVEEGAPPSPL